MGWGSAWTPPTVRQGSPWNMTGLTAAIAAYCALLVVAGVVDLVVSPALESSYGPGGGGALFLCLLPVLMGVVATAGVFAALVQALPCADLGQLLARRTRMPRWLCCLAAVASLSALYAWPAVYAGLPFRITWLWMTGMGALPALAASLYVHREELGKAARLGEARRIVFQISMTAVGVIGVLFAGGVVAYGTGLVEEYEPPRLTTAADYVGTWRDEYGGVIRFKADGSFTATRIREYSSDAWDLEGPFASHSGTGSWRRAAQETDGENGLDLQFGDGGGLADWGVRGTDARPAIYYYVGDPDAGDWYALTKDVNGATPATR